MPEKYFVDTLVWRDYYENRNDRFRPLGEWALAFFKKVLEEENIIIYSDVVERELGEKYDAEAISDIFSVINKNCLLQKIEVQSNQVKEAAKLSKERHLPFGDAIHAVVARDNRAIMITRDHHFEEMQDVVISKKPEDLL